MGTDFIFSAARARELHIESNTAGYFLYARDFSVSRDAGTDTEIILELEKLAPGKTALIGGY